jgi:hypothetical protein
MFHALSRLEIMHLFDTNFEVTVGFQFTASIVNGSAYRAVKMNHLSTVSKQYNHMIRNNQTVDLKHNKLHKFFTRVCGFHKIVLFLLSSESSFYMDDGGVDPSADVSDEDLKIIAQNNPCLIELQILNCGVKFSVKGIHEVLKCNELKSLELWACHLQSSDFIAMFCTPPGNTYNLTHLNITTQ